MYELLYIVPAPFTEKDLPNVSKKIEEIIKSLDGQITKENNLGSKKLAYPIKQVYRGFYVLVNFEVEPKKLKELNQKLKLTPGVLRHMIVKALIPGKMPPEAKKKEIIKTEEKKEIKKEKKIDLKKLGKKIDDLFKI